jgi:hypothetical protein
MYALRDADIWRKYFKQKWILQYLLKYAVH